MKTIFINRFFYPDYSATSQMLSDLVFSLAASGREVHVVTSPLSYDDQGHQIVRGQEKLNGVTVHRVWSSHFGRNNLLGRSIDYLSFYIFGLWKLFWLTRAGDTIVAKTDPPMLSVVSRWVTHWRGACLVNWLQDLFPEVAIVLPVKGFGGWLGRWLIAVRNKSLSLAAMNVVLGSRMQTHLRSQGIVAEKIQIIHNWANGKDIQMDKQAGVSLRKQWQLGDKFVVGYSGNLGRAHEYQTLLETMLLLRDEQDICFLFIGGGSLMAELKKIVAEKALPNVMFEPYQPRASLPQSLAVPDVHLTVLRPDMEGLIVPSKFYGILAAGKASIFIGDRHGEVAKLLGESDAGLVVNTGESTQLAEQLILLRDDKSALSRMGTNAREAFDQQYSADQALSRWQEVLAAVEIRACDGMAAELTDSEQ